MKPYKTIIPQRFRPGNSGKAKTASPSGSNLSLDLQLRALLLKVMPPAEAKIYSHLIRLLPGPYVKSAGGGRIKYAELAKLTGFSTRWVLERAGLLYACGMLVLRCAVAERGFCCVGEVAAD